MALGENDEVQDERTVFGNFRKLTSKVVYLCLFPQRLGLMGMFALALIVATF